MPPAAPPLSRSSPDTPNPKIIRLTKQSWFVLGVWGLLIFLCLLIGAGRVFAPLYLVGSLAVGLFLYFRTPALYIGYTWWMFFVGALIRRIIDYQAGYITFGRWGLPALLVACVSLITLFKYLPTSFRKGGAPFIISFVGVLYAFMIGVAYDRLDARYGLGLLEWIGPLAFGFHLFLQWREYPQISQVIQKTFVWGTAVMGSYSIYQFCGMPPWDAFYMQQLSATSFGAPVAFEVRVFGTQGSPQSFATTMMAGLILLLSSQGTLRFAASGTGYLGFLLTRARSGWFGWCMAMITLLPALNVRLQMRLVTTLLVMSLLIIPLINLEPFAGVISERLDSFTNIENIEEDQSFQDRNEGYSQLTGTAVRQVIGQGLGASFGSSVLGGADTAILPLLFGFGWFGTLPYLGGIVCLLIQICQDQLARSDAFSSASRAIALGVFSQIVFNQIFVGGFAVILWGFIGMGMAASKYHQAQIRHFTSLQSPVSISPQP